MYVYIKMYTPTLAATQHEGPVTLVFNIPIDNKHLVPYQVSSHACMVSLSLVSARTHASWQETVW